tara:strand:+ start:78 stop:749 length:672 start_codon:yes stop_codon:yes gene_type:complete
MNFVKTELELKGKHRRFEYCEELNLFKRERTFNGIRCLAEWECISDHIDLNEEIRCLEIGTHEGQSAMYFLKNILINPKSTLTCVDPFYKSHWIKDDPSGLCYEDIWDLNKSNNDMNNQLIKYTGLNSDYYNSEEFKNTIFDIIYIDDNHTYESTMLNIKECIPKLKSGGIIIFDDYDGKFCDKDDHNAGYKWTEPVMKAINDTALISKGEIIFQNYQLILKI